MADGLHSLPAGPSAAIESIIQNYSINNVKVSVEGAVPKGQNYSGVIYRVTVTGEKDEQDVTTSYIVKVAINDENARNVIGMSSVYQREHMFYTEVFPIYQRMQDEAGILVENRFRLAKCYHADKEYLNEFLIFEDLKPLGYVTLDRKCEVDYEHARCALEAYGKLHALSFALKKREPEKFQYFTQNSNEVVILKDGVIANFFRQACEKAIPALENEQYRNILESIKDDIIDRLIDTLTQDEFSVLSHSDCWSANMMFNYKDGKPVETCLIDFQICRYGSPGLDVMYYVFGNTGHKLREERYEDLMSVYHNAMKDHLKALSYDIEHIYPWARFQQDLKKSAIFGLVSGLSLATVLLLDEESVPEMSDFVDLCKSRLFNSHISNIYKQRVNDLVEDFFKYGDLSLPLI